MSPQHTVDVRLRPLRAADLDRVVRLEQQLFGRGAWTYGTLAEELGGIGRWYVAAEPVRRDVAGAQPVVGYAGLWFDGDVAQIMTIGVDPAVQHLGIGSRLLTALIDRARELRAGAVLLEVRVDNDAALGMYAKFGFEQLGIRRRYYQPEDVDAYTMRLELLHEDVVAPDDVVLPEDPARRAPAGSEDTGPGDAA